MRIPDFFIAGAPKCGTTALDAYLRAHPRIFMAEKKETFFFARDFPAVQFIKTWDQYLARFAAAPAHALVGETSVWYLYSQCAIQSILEVNPNARFIVSLRNPVDAAYSLYFQHRISIEEDAPDFQTAWTLQAGRQAGMALPEFYRVPELLQYRKIYSYSPQLERLLQMVPSRQILIVIFEEFAADPRATYDNVLQFLGIDSDSRSRFAPVNANAVHWSNRLAVFLKKLHQERGLVYEMMKRAANAIGLQPYGMLARMNRREARRPPLDPDFRRQLQAEFADDITRLEHLLGRTLALWRTDAAALAGPSRPPADATAPDRSHPAAGQHGA